MSEKDEDTAQELIVHVKRDSEDNKETNKEKDFTDQFGTQMLETLKTRCMALNVDYSEPKSMIDVIALKSACDEAEEANSDPDERGSAGQATLDMRTGNSGQNEFESTKTMVEHLLVKSHSSDPELRKEASAVLDELYTKWSRAVKSGKMPHGIEFEEKEGEESILGAYKRLMDRIARDKAEGRE